MENKIQLRALTKSDLENTLKWHNQEDIKSLYMGHPFPVNREIEAKCFSGCGRIWDFSRLVSNNLIFDYAIKYTKQKNCKYFHLGGGNTSDKKDSLLKVKSGFSKTRADFYIGKKIRNQKIYDEIVRQWENRFPERKDKDKDYLLKCRNVK